MKPIKQAELLDAILVTLGIARDEDGGDDARPPAPCEASGTVTDVPPDEGRGDAGGPSRILVVDDNVVNQKVALKMLEKAGHEVMIASNGKEAIEILAKQDFDTVLMDVQMPEMDGLEATRLIRSRETTEDRHQVIIAMTAHAMVGDAEKCFEAGMDGYVSKPFRQAEFLAAIAAARTRLVAGDATARSES